MIRTRTPDSFNKHAAPGTSLFDGTEATPQPLRRPDGGASYPPRARRRIAFGAVEPAGARLSPRNNARGSALTDSRRATEDGFTSRPPPHFRRRSRSLSPRATPKVTFFSGLPTKIFPLSIRGNHRTPMLHSVQPFQLLSGVLRKCSRLFLSDQFVILRCLHIHLNIWYQCHVRNMGQAG